jgi:hypothetical protein
MFRCDVCFLVFASSIDLARHHMIEKAREGDKLTVQMKIASYRRWRPKRVTPTADAYSPELFLKQYR